VDSQTVVPTISPLPRSIAAGLRTPKVKWLAIDARSLPEYYLNYEQSTLSDDVEDRLRDSANNNEGSMMNGPLVNALFGWESL